MSVLVCGRCNRNLSVVDSETLDGQAALLFFLIGGDGTTGTPCAAQIAMASAKPCGSFGRNTPKGRVGGR